MKNFWNGNGFSGISFFRFLTVERFLPKFLYAFWICQFCQSSISGHFPEKIPFIIMYVNINRYLKIYLSNPPFIIYTPRSNTWKKAKGKKGKIRPPNVNVCETTLTYLLFFTIFSTFLCYRRKFSVKSSTGREIRGGFFMPQNFAMSILFPIFARKSVRSCSRSAINASIMALA